MKSYLFEDYCYREVHKDGLPFYQHGADDPCDRDLDYLFTWAAFPSRGSRILELGCGDGFVTAILARMGLLVTGVDCSPAAIEQAGRNLDRLGLSADLRVGDSCDLDFLESGTFPYILDSHCLHCVTDYGERQALLRESHRLLEGSGTVFLATMAEQPMDWTDSMGPNPWRKEYGVDDRGCSFESLVPPGTSDRVKSRLFVSREVLLDEVRTAGLEIERIERFSPDNDPTDFSFLVQARKRCWGRPG